MKATRVSEVMPLRDHEVAAVTFDLTKRALQTSLPSTMAHLSVLSLPEKKRKQWQKGDEAKGN